MRILHLFLLSLLILPSILKAQHVAAERSYNNSWGQEAMRICSDGEHDYLAIAEFENSFSSNRYIQKVDSLGNVLWSQNITTPGEWLSLDFMEVHDEQLILVGKTQGCDIAIGQLYAKGWSLDGELIWDAGYPEPEGLFEASWYNVHDAYWLNDELAIAYQYNDSTFIDIVANGSIASSANVGTMVLDEISLQDNGNVLVADDEALFKFDPSDESFEPLLSLSGQVTSLTNATPVSHLVTAGDSIHLVGDNGFVNSFAWDGFTNLNRVKRLDSTIMLTAEHSDSLCVVQLGVGFAPAEVSCLVPYSEPKIDFTATRAGVAEKYDLVEENAVRYRSFSFDEGVDFEPERGELEILEIQPLDTLVTGIIQGEPNVATGSFRFDVLVKNNSENVVNSCNLNGLVTFGPCGPIIYYEHFQGIEIEPDGTLWLSTSWLPANYFIAEENIASVAYCLYTSNPNGHVDFVVENDELCATFEVDILSVEELDAPPLSIYPNPASDYVMLEGLAQGVYKYAITSLNGQVMQMGSSDQAQLDVSSLPVGMYLLAIEEEGMGKRVAKVFVGR